MPNHFITIKSLKHTDTNCNIDAIATIDQYYAEKFGFQNIPLHKSDNDSISIRQISKRFRSVQGELLELDQLVSILMYLGYQVEDEDFRDNRELLVDAVEEEINKDQPVLAFISVDPKTKKLSSNSENNKFEQTVIITGYSEKLKDDEKKSLDLFADKHHWSGNLVEKIKKKPFELVLLYSGIRDTVAFKDFYSSSMSLPNQKTPEHYIRTANNKLFFKDKKIIQTIHPEDKSGFRGKLIKISVENELLMRERRNKLLQKHAIDYKKLYKEQERKNKSLLLAVCAIGIFCPIAIVIFFPLYLLLEKKDIQKTKLKKEEFEKFKNAKNNLENQLRNNRNVIVSKPKSTKIVHPDNSVTLYFEPSKNKYLTFRKPNKLNKNQSVSQKKANRVISL